MWRLEWRVTDHSRLKKEVGLPTPAAACHTSGHVFSTAEKQQDNRTKEGIRHFPCLRQSTATSLAIPVSSDLASPQRLLHGETPGHCTSNQIAQCCISGPHGPMCSDFAFLKAKIIATSLGHGHAHTSKLLQLVSSIHHSVCSNTTAQRSEHLWHADDHCF